MAEECFSKHPVRMALACIHRRVKRRPVQASDRKSDMKESSFQRQLVLRPAHQAGFFKQLLRAGPGDHEGQPAEVGDDAGQQAANTGKRTGRRRRR